MIDSRNEWGEASMLEPSDAYAYGYESLVSIPRSGLMKLLIRNPRKTSGVCMRLNLIGSQIESCLI